MTTARSTHAARLVTIVSLCGPSWKWYAHSQTMMPLNSTGKIGNEQFNCNTSSCSLHDNWYAIPMVDKWADKASVCLDAQAEALQGFGALALENCQIYRQINTEWTGCRQGYCDMYKTIVDRIIYEGGPGYFGGAECRPLLNFNHTLCMTSYRDAEAFCDCFCPALVYVPASTVCKNELVDFYTLGRRGVELAERYTLSFSCASQMCEWINTIGDPRKPMIGDLDYGGVPPKCRDLSLPFQPGFCTSVFKSRPYDPCPFEFPTQDDLVLECMSGHTCEIDIKNADSWSCCQEHNYRKHCPAAWPVMCSNPLACNGNNDHCCETSESLCDNGEKRECSPMLALELPEWTGIYASGVQLPDDASTTLSLEEQLLKDFTTTAGPTWGETLRPLAPLFLGIAGGVGLVVACVAFRCITKQHSYKIRITLFGLPRLLKVLQTDPVSTFLPSGEPKFSKAREAPVPDPPDPRIAEKVRLDDAACASLEAAVEDAYSKGSEFLVTFVNEPPLPQEQPLIDAIALVRRRGLQHRGRNSDLIERGEKWSRVLQAERDLVIIIHEIRPDLQTVSRGWHTQNPGDGPFRTTKIGQVLEADAKCSYWARIEHLTEAIRVARVGGAGAKLVEQADNLLGRLVARTRELPADRCVLDPDGEGVKLLPFGSNRAVWPTSGEAYVFRQGAEYGQDLGESSPPKETLGKVATDDVRPVCSFYVQKGKCHLGRKCPWRHCKPLPGDSVREPVTSFLEEP